MSRWGNHQLKFISQLTTQMSIPKSEQLAFYSVSHCPLLLLISQEYEWIMLQGLSVCRSLTLWGGRGWEILCRNQASDVNQIFLQGLLLAWVMKLLDPANQ